MPFRFPPAQQICPFGCSHPPIAPCFSELATQRVTATAQAFSCLQVCNGLFGDMSAAVACRTMGKVAPNKGQGMMMENTNNRFGELPALRLCRQCTAHHGSSTVAHVLATLAHHCCLQVPRPATPQSGWLGSRALGMSRIWRTAGACTTATRWAAATGEGGGFQGRNSELPGLPG